MNVTLLESKMGFTNDKPYGMSRVQTFHDGSCHDDDADGISLSLFYFLSGLICTHITLIFSHSLFILIYMPQLFLLKGHFVLWNRKRETLPSLLSPLFGKIGIDFLLIFSRMHLDKQNNKINMIRCIIITCVVKKIIRQYFLFSHTDWLSLFTSRNKIIVIAMYHEVINHKIYFFVRKFFIPNKLETERTFFMHLCHLHLVWKDRFSRRFQRRDK